MVNDRGAILSICCKTCGKVEIRENVTVPDILKMTTSFGWFYGNHGFCYCPACAEHARTTID